MGEGEGMGSYDQGNGKGNNILNISKEICVSLFGYGERLIICASCI